MIGTLSGQLKPSDTVQSRVNDHGIGTKLLGVIFVMLAANLTAGTAVFNRSLKAVDYSIVMFFHGLFGFLCAISYFSFVYLFSGADKAEAMIKMFSLSTSDALMLTFGAIIDSIAVFGQTVAFQRSASGFVSLISFVNVVYALLTDYFIFYERIELKEIFAAGIICSVTIIVAVMKIR